MINSAVQFVLAVLVLVLGAAFEELLPKFLGVGIPVLLAAVLFFASRRSGSASLAFAVAAGALEDALSSLPPMTSVSYFLAMAVVVRRFGCLWPCRILAYPCYQVWLAVWVVGIGGGVFERVLLACPVGVATVLAGHAVLGGLCRKAAVDERG